MSSIFISYSRRDIEFARQIVDALAENNLDTWIDWQSIPKGEDWETEIYRGIEAADIFIFLMSPDSVRSEMCNKEIEHAKENSKRIIPIVIRDADTNDFRLNAARDEVKRRNWIILANPVDDFDPVIREILNTIQTDFEWLKFHTKLQLQALEWERSGYEKSLHLRGKELENAESQLAANSSKDPFPTNIQRNFILQSRLASVRQRRTTTSIAITGMVVLAIVSVIAIVQAGLARTAEATAVSNQGTAQAASTLAIENEEKAKEQEQIARMRELSAQSQLNADQSPSRALLLAAAAAQINKDLNIPISPVVQQALHNALSKTDGLPLPGGSITASSVQFTPNGRWLIILSDLDTAQAWETSRFWQAPITVENAQAATFTSSGSILFNTDINLEIWDFSSDTPKRILQFTFDRHVAPVSLGEKSYALDQNGYSSRDYAISPDGHWFGIFDVNGTLSLFDLHSPNAQPLKYSTPFKVDEQKFISFSPKGNWLVVRGSNGEYLQKLELLNGSLMSLRQEASYPALIQNGLKVVPFIQFSPDENWMLLSGQNTELWDISEGKLSNHLTLSNNSGFVEFSPASRHLLRRGNDQMYLWNIPEQISTLVLEPSITSPTDTVPSEPSYQAFSFSSDGQYMMMASGREIRLWNVVTGAFFGPKTIDSRMLYANLLPNASGLIIVTEDGQLTYYSQTFATEKNLMVLQEPTVPIIGGSNFKVGISSDSRFVAILGGDQKLHLLDLDAPSATTTEQFVTAQSFSDFALSKDGRWLVAGSATDSVPRIWDLQNLDTQMAERVVRTFPGGQDPQGIGLPGTGIESPGFAFAISSDGRWLANLADSTVQLFDLSGMTPTPILLGSGVSSITFSPDHHWLALSSYASQTIEAWNMDVFPPAKEITFKLPTSRIRIIQLQFSPDEKWLIAKSNWQVFVFDWEHQEFSQPSILGREQPRMSGGGGGIDLDFRPGDNLSVSPDSRWLAFGFNQNITSDGIHTGTSKTVWKLGSLVQPVFDLKGLFASDTSITTSMRFSHDGRWMVSIPGASGIAVLWDLNSRDPNTTYRVLTGNRRLASATDFNPDDHWLATGHGNDIYLWDLTSSDPTINPRILQGHSKTIWSLAFSSDGRTLASGSRDKTIRIWDMTSQNIITSAIVLNGHTADVYDIAFAKNGTTLASNALDDTTRVWNIDINEMISLACKKSGRNLTEKEWSLYFVLEPYHDICLASSSEASNFYATPTAAMTEKLTATLESATTSEGLLRTPTPDKLIPTSTVTSTFSQYVVQPGDTLTSIASKFRVPIEVIIQDNNLIDPNAIVVGQTLKIRISATP